MGSNHFEPLQTRASTRQGLRRLPSRPASAAATAALTKRTSNPALSHNAAAAANNNLIDSNHNNHSNNNSSAANSKDNDSSDDEIPVPMKLSALTKALLEDDGGVDAQSSQQQQQPRKPSPPLTRQRSNNLAASTSAVPAEERRHRRAGSVQAPVVSQSQQQSSVATHSGSAEGVGGGTSSQQSSPARRTRDDGNNSPVRKRIIRLSTTPKLGAAVGSGRLRRSTSLNASQSRGRPPSRDGSVAGDAVQQSQDAPAATAAEMPNVNTPTAQQPMRVVRIAVGSSGQKRTATAAASSSFVGSARKTDSVEGHVSTAHEQPQHQTDEPATVARSQSAAGSQGSVSRFVPSAARNRFVAGGVGSGGSEDPAAPQGSSMRVKRIGKVPGSFLSGPARRGRRRQSEDENSPADENGEAGIQLPSSSQEEADGGHQRHHRNVELISEAAVGQQPQQQSFYSRGFASGSPDAKDPARARRPAVNQLLSMGSKATADGYSPPNFDELLKLPSGLLPKAQPRPVDLPSARDQENDVGASFRKSALGMMPSDKDLMKPPPRPAVVKMDAAQMQPPAAPVASAIMASPERKPLSMLSQNTPHRPPPPPPTASASMGPPKMSIAETATSAAGAATTAQGANKLRKNVMKVNGKTYTRLDCLGRGGSGKVYRVSAENGKMFALKRVSIEDADESVIKGYRGEIDLLKKLRGVERVISLIDYEMNDEKQMLSLVSALWHPVVKNVSTS